MKNLITTLLLITIQTTSSYLVCSQDLIKDTQNGILPNLEMADTNLIYHNANQKFAHSTYVQVSPFILNASSKQHIERYNKTVSDALFLNSKPRIMRQLYNARPENVKFTIPVLRGKDIELLLYKKDITAPGFEVTTSSRNTIDFKSNEGLFYHGVVTDHPGSIAAVSIFANSIRVMISDQNGNYVLAAIQNEENTKKSTNNLYTFYNDQNLLINFNPICVNRGPTSVDPEPSCTNTVSNTFLIKHFVEVFVECDFTAFNNLYNNSEFYTYTQISAAFNETAVTYSMEEMEIKLSELHIVNKASDQDPILNGYISSPTNWEEVLDEFSNIKQDDYNGRLACLVFYATTSSGAIWSTGVGNPGRFNCDGLDVAALCANYYDQNNDGADPWGPYSVLTPINDIDNFPVYSRDVYLLAHEIGHNFGSFHTHNCSWGPNGNQALDDCAALETGSFDCTSLPVLGQIPTIMSYCTIPSLINGFGEEPGDEIRSNYNLKCGSSGSLDCQGDVDIFTDFPFLLDLVDPNNCTDTKITVWLFGGFFPIFYVHNSLGGKLFHNFGHLTEFCDDGDTPGSCLEIIDFGDVAAHWTCNCCSGTIDGTNFDAGVFKFTPWYDGGDDCRIVNSNTQALSNPYSVELQDNSGSASSIMTTNLSVPANNQLNVSFSFIARSMEYGEDF